MRFITETVVSIGAAGSAFIVGQVVDMPHVPGVPKLDIANLTATGILGWYAWHTASRTIPSMIKDFREESKEQRETFKGELRIERETHRDAVESLRQSIERRASE